MLQWLSAPFGNGYRFTSRESVVLTVFREGPAPDPISSVLRHWPR